MDTKALNALEQLRRVVMGEDDDDEAAAACCCHIKTTACHIEEACHIKWLVNDMEKEEEEEEEEEDIKPRPVSYHVRWLMKAMDQYIEEEDDDEEEEEEKNREEEEKQQQQKKKKKTPIQNFISLPYTDSENSNIWAKESAYVKI